jgi:hypothetical protein
MAGADAASRFNLWMPTLRERDEMSERFTPALVVSFASPVPLSAARQ